jgi:ABC-type nitrate/sulfonate/bicarbonate transport system permease component
VAFGGVLGVGAGFLLAVLLLGCPRPAGRLLAGVGSSVALSAPAAVIALACVWFDIDAAWAVAVAVLPHALQYLAGVLESGAQAEHVLAARARGIGRRRILFVHIVTPALGELAAVCGMAVTVALGAAIPVEAITSRPGLGQLVWQAAQSRDLPVLVNMTVLLAVVTIGANTIGDVVVAVARPARGGAA